jgi:acetyl esterase
MKPPAGIRLLSSLRPEPDWSTIDLDAYRDAENRRRSSPLMRVVSGFPARGVTIAWHTVALADRTVRVRVHRPHAVDALPLVVHIHGGGFVGTAPQSDWINSHLAARLPAVVVSVEHRLVSSGTPLSAAVDDGWDVLQHLLATASSWGIDPARAAVFGESAGSVVAALAAIRARGSIRAQVLVNPCVDLTAAAFDHPSMREHADGPMLTEPLLRFFLRLAVPPGTDSRAVSPLYAGEHRGLAPALVVVPAVDPLADHGRTYAAHLRAAGVPVTLAEHPGATHAFLSTPRLVPQAKAARREIIDFLRTRLTEGAAVGRRSKT